MYLNQKRWLSFDDMYTDLKGQNYFSNYDNDLLNNLNKIINSLEKASESKIFFESICKISSYFENLTQVEKDDIYQKTNIYVTLLNACLRNVFFINYTIELSKSGKSIEDLKSNKFHLEKLTFINTVLSSAFFAIATNYTSIGKESIEFLRENITDLVKTIKREDNEIDFIDCCFLLEKIIWDNRLHLSEGGQSKFPIKLNANYLFSNLKLSRSIAGVSLLSLVIKPVIEREFKNQASFLEGENFDLSKAYGSIFHVVAKLNYGIEHYYKNAPGDITVFFNIFIKNNERNLIFYLLEFCRDFQDYSQRNFYDIIWNKIYNSNKAKIIFNDYSLKRLSAFSKLVESHENEWTNKIFLVTIKTLSVLETLSSVIDKKWAMSVAIRELYNWLTEVHEILNKFYIEDDWKKIEKYCSLETSEIEWKSSLYTPSQQEYINEESYQAESKKIFDIIIKTILAMINTSGGVLLVGLVENPDKVVNKAIKENLIFKNGLSFFDISFELRKIGRNLDQVKLQVLDKLKSNTNTSADQFNNLFEFEPINLKSKEKSISILKVNITASQNLFYNFKEEAGVKWISLSRRAEGQTINVDPREHI